MICDLVESFMYDFLYVIIMWTAVSQHEQGFLNCMTDTNCELSKRKNLSNTDLDILDNIITKTTRYPKTCTRDELSFQLLCISVVMLQLALITPSGSCPREQEKPKSSVFPPNKTTKPRWKVLHHFPSQWAVFRARSRKSRAGLEPLLPLRRSDQPTSSLRRCRRRRRIPPRKATSGRGPCGDHGCTPYSSHPSWESGSRGRRSRG